VRVPAGAPVTLLQRAPAPLRPWDPGQPAEDPQFAGCRYAGAATITAQTPIVAVVNQTGPAGASAYEALDRASTSNQVQVPLVQAGNPHSASGIQIQNLDPGPVSVTLTYSPNAATRSPEDPGPDDRCPAPPARPLQLPGDGSATVLLGGHPTAEPWSKTCRYVGSVTITGPGGTHLAALANQVSGDPAMTDQLATTTGS